MDRVEIRGHRDARRAHGEQGLPVQRRAFSVQGRRRDRHRERAARHA